ncbi:MAG: molybdate ABC transporter substrate-binding protein [Armatimonadota bacterium]|nr:MAG: molybdate ABC transporter substrate-binding protein [Armatimonadota bacterium]
MAGKAGKMTMEVKRIIIVTVVCALVTAAVVIVVSGGQAATTLLVHAGAGIRPALDELGALFQKETGTRVDYNYKGSACLLPDVCVSKKGDAYIPGELYFMQQAVDRELVKSGYKVVASMTTVLIVQAGNPKQIESVRDLGKPGIRLGLGDPQAVAIGRAARECLVKAGVWKQAEKNLVMSAQNVTELSNSVKMKHIDASIVWDATAALYNEKEMVTITIDPAHAVCSPVPAGALKFSKSPRDAQAYVEFLASPEALKIFLKHGFGPPMKTDKACKTGER